MPRQRFASALCSVALLVSVFGCRSEDAKAHAEAGCPIPASRLAKAGCTPSMQDGGDAASPMRNEAGAARDGAARQGDASDESCGAQSAQGRVYPLCIWTEPDDLARLYEDPKARLEIAAQVGLGRERYAGVELELHGGSARTWPKKSYRLRFSESDVKYDFFGDGAQRIERIVLQAAWVDPSFVRAKLLFDLLRELGGLAPRIGYARLYINGEAQGLYQVIERIDGEFLEKQGFSQSGNLYKAETHAANWAVKDDPLLGFAERTNEDGKAPDLAALFSAIASTEGSHEAFERELAPLVSFEDFTIWHLVMSYALNLDTFDKNYYLYHDPAAPDAEHGSVFRIIQWDADTTFGLWWTGERYETPDADELYGAQNRLAARMFEIPEYREAYLERFSTLLDGPFSHAVMGKRAKALIDELEDAIREDLALYDRATSFEAERTFLDEMIALRHDVMRKAVDAARKE